MPDTGHAILCPRIMIQISEFFDRFTHSINDDVSLLFK